MRMYSKQTRIAARRWLRWVVWQQPGAEPERELRLTLALWLATLAVLCATCVAQPVQAEACKKGYELERGKCVPIQKKAVPGSWVTCTLPMKPVCDYQTGLCWCRYRSK